MIQISGVEPTANTKRFVAITEGIPLVFNRVVIPQDAIMGETWFYNDLLTSFKGMEFGVITFIYPKTFELDGDLVYFKAVIQDHYYLGLKAQYSLRGICD